MRKNEELDDKFIYMGADIRRKKITRVNTKSKLVLILILLEPLSLSVCSRTTVLGQSNSMKTANLIIYSLRMAYNDVDASLFCNLKQQCVQ